MSLEITRALLAERGRLKCRIVSDSMEPLLRVGDVIEIEPVRTSEELRRFDILVFQHRGEMTCHFLWNKNTLGKTPTITTRSLKNPREDDLPTAEECLLGRVIDRRIPWWLRLKLVLLNARRP